MHSGDMKMLESHILNNEEKKIICSWKYEGEYALYNMPSYESMFERQFGFCNPKNTNNYKAYYDGNIFVGFTNAYEEESEIFVGIGVNPECCSHGYGQKMLQMLSEDCSSLYSNKQLYLEVRSWNKRAIACYQKAGFVIDGEEYEQETSIGKGLFYRMVKR